MKKYLIITSTTIFTSMIGFSIYNGSIFIEGVDKLSANIITIHVEVLLLNYLVAKFVQWKSRS